MSTSRSRTSCSEAIDFRRNYATVLERWLRLPAGVSLGDAFEPMPLFRS